MCCGCNNNVCGSWIWICHSSMTVKCLHLRQPGTNMFGSCSYKQDIAPYHTCQCARQRYNSHEAPTATHDVPSSYQPLRIYRISFHDFLATQVSNIVLFTLLCWQRCDQQMTWKRRCQFVSWCCICICRRPLNRLHIYFGKWPRVWSSARWLLWHCSAHVCQFGFVVC